MDIRKFFGANGSSASPKPSVLSIEKAKNGSPPSKKQHQAVEDKKKKNAAKLKRRPIQISDEDQEECVSDGENPIPTDLRKQFKEKGQRKRHRIILSDDDDETIQPRASTSASMKVSPDPPPSKNKTETRKKTVQKKRKPTPEPIQQEEEVLSSDNDFVTPPLKATKRGMKKTSPGQGKLKFAPTTSRQVEPAKEPNKKVVTGKLKQVNVVDFFNAETKKTALTTTISGQKTTTIGGQKTTTTTISGQKTTTVSGQKTTPVKANGKASVIEIDDESEESDRSSNPKKKKKTIEKRVSPRKAKPVEVCRPIESPKKTAAIASSGLVKRATNSTGTKKTTPPESPSPKKAKIAVELPIKVAKTVPKPPPTEVQKSDEKKSPVKRSSQGKVEKSPVKTSSEATVVKSPAKWSSQTTVEKNKSTSMTAKSSTVITKPKASSPKKTIEIPSIAKANSTTSSSVQVPWVDKYRPLKEQHLVGQSGDKSPYKKLLFWLQEWAKHHLGTGARVKKGRPSPWEKDGSYFKAVLLSGAPGVGKSTCAAMACKQLGLASVEMNASDARNKKLLEGKVTELTGSMQIDQFMQRQSTVANRSSSSTAVSHVLIMDEVDGMSGNEDRAGLSELIAMIKSTKIPIICICNERQAQKMRTLVNYCYDLRFNRPQVQQIRGRMMMISQAEGLKLTGAQLDEVIEASNHDVRQVIYNLQMLGAGGGTAKDIVNKDCSLNVFEAAREILSHNSSLPKKNELFFTDYSLMPLFIQENYLHLKNSKMSNRQRLNAFRMASDCISLGDLVDRTLRTSGSWSLLNEQSMLSCALPASYLNGYLGGQLNFPSWLGKNSNALKRQRLVRQLVSHTHLQISADCSSLVTDYMPVIKDRLTRPLLQDDSAEGVRSVVDFYKAYDLTRDDAEAISELSNWSDKNYPAMAIQSKVKASLTRALNKEHRLLPYATGEISKGKRGKASGTVEPTMEMDEEGNLVEVLAGDEEEAENEGSSDTEETTMAVVTKQVVAKAGRGGGGGGGAQRGRGGRGKGRGK